MPDPRDMKTNVNTSEHIPGLAELVLLADKDNSIGAELAWEIVNHVRTGASLEEVAERSGQSKVHVRALVTSIGRVLGQSLKDRPKANVEELPVSTWTNGRGANPRSYAWLLSTEVAEIAIALTKVVDSEEEPVTYEHHLDLWYAGNSGWLNLAEVVAKPRQARAYVQAASEVEKRLIWLSKGSVNLLKALNEDNVTEEMYEWVQAVNWHIPALGKGKYADWKISVGHLSRQKDLAVKDGLRCIKFEDLMNLLEVPEPTWVKQLVGAGV